MSMPWSCRSERRGRLGRFFGHQFGKGIAGQRIPHCTQCRPRLQQLSDRSTEGQGKAHVCELDDNERGKHMGTRVCRSSSTQPPVAEDCYGCHCNAPEPSMIPHCLVDRCHVDLGAGHDEATEQADDVGRKQHEQ